MSGQTQTLQLPCGGQNSNQNSYHLPTNSDLCLKCAATATTTSIPTPISSSPGDGTLLGYDDDFTQPSVNGSFDFEWPCEKTGWLGDIEDSYYSQQQQQQQQFPVAQLAESNMNKVHLPNDFLPNQEDPSEIVPWSIQSSLNLDNIGHSSSPRHNHRLSNSSSSNGTAPVEKPSHPHHDRKRHRKEEDCDDRSAARSSHAAVERKYRQGINSKFDALSRVIGETLDNQSSPCHASKDNDLDEASSPISQLRKGDVLTDAINYVSNAEREKAHAAEEVSYLRQRIVALEKLVNCEDCPLLKQMSAMSFQNHQCM